MKLLENGNAHDTILIECIRQTLSNILGKNGMQAILYHIETGFRLKIDDFPNDPSRFASALEHIFGVGASVIEDAILNEIKSNRAVSIKYSYFVKTVMRDREKDLSAYRANYLSKPKGKREQYAMGWESFIFQEMTISVDVILDKGRYEEQDYMAMELDESSLEKEVAKIRNFP